MNFTRIKLRKWQLALGIPLMLLVGFFIILFAIRLVTGRSLGLRSFVERNTYFIANPVRAIIDSSTVQDSGQGELNNIIFLHHSTGSNLIAQGQVRELLQQQGYTFWDHGYNEQGLRDADGLRTGYSYNIPGDNTNPNGLAAIFQQTPHSFPTNAFSGLLQHDVIVLKSCFRPANNIRSDEQLEQYKNWYLEMRAVMDQYPDKVFILVTTPPLNPAETNPAEAARARESAGWLTSEEFLAGHPNIFTFDFFNYLADGDATSADFNMLHAEYCNGNNSHPNQIANQTIGPLFAEFIAAKIQGYVSTK